MTVLSESLSHRMNMFCEVRAQKLGPGEALLTRKPKKWKF